MSEKRSVLELIDWMTVAVVAAVSVGMALLTHGGVTAWVVIYPLLAVPSFFAFDRLLAWRVTGSWRGQPGDTEMDA